MFQIFDANKCVIHGSYIDNLELILNEGLAPPKLQKSEKQIRTFGNKPSEEGMHGIYLQIKDSLPLYVVQTGFMDYSLKELNLWTEPNSRRIPFHYLMICDYNLVKESKELSHHEFDVLHDSKKDNFPHHTKSEKEIHLYNQRIAASTFVGIVMPTLNQAIDYFVSGLYKEKSPEEMLSLVKFALIKSNLEIPIFEMTGKILN